MNLSASQLLAMFSRPISFHRKLVDVTGSVTSAIMLGQAIFWSDITADPEGWFYKSQEEWKKETGMNRSEQEGARKTLRALGFWEENYERLTHRLWFRVNPDKFKEVAEALLKISNGECGKQEMAKRDIQQSSNSAEITSEEEVLTLNSEPKKRKTKIGTVNGHKPTQSEVEDFAASIGQPRLDGEMAYLKWNAKGWPKNWMDDIRYHKRAGWLHSQKQQAATEPKNVTMKL